MNGIGAGARRDNRHHTGTAVTDGLADVGRMGWLGSFITQPAISKGGAMADANAPLCAVMATAPCPD
ncbi:MAG: hypothetical protein ACRC2U_06640 [Aeromonas sp.]